jgi:cobalamin biosynthesis Mg chelatase CobN
MEGSEVFAPDDYEDEDGASLGAGRADELGRLYGVGATALPAPIAESVHEDTYSRYADDRRTRAAPQSSASAADLSVGARDIDADADAGVDLEGSVCMALEQSLAEPEEEEPARNKPCATCRRAGRRRCGCAQSPASAARTMFVSQLIASSQTKDQSPAESEGEAEGLGEKRTPSREASPANMSARAMAWVQDWAVPSGIALAAVVAVAGVIRVLRPSGNQN